MLQSHSPTPDWEFEPWIPVPLQYGYCRGIDILDFKDSSYYSKNVYHTSPAPLHEKHVGPGPLQPSISLFLDSITLSISIPRFSPSKIFSFHPCIRNIWKMCFVGLEKGKTPKACLNALCGAQLRQYNASLTSQTQAHRTCGWGAECNKQETLTAICVQHFS